MFPNDTGPVVRGIMNAETFVPNLPIANDNASKASYLHGWILGTHRAEDIAVEHGDVVAVEAQ